MLCQLRLDDFATKIQPTTNEKRHVETCEPPRSQWDPSHLRGLARILEFAAVAADIDRHTNSFFARTEAMSFEVVGAENVGHQQYPAHHMSRHQERVRLD